MDETHSGGLPLFNWQTAGCEIIPFPTSRRVGRIRDTAHKLLDKPTEKSAERYRQLVTESLEASFSKIGLDEMKASEQIGAFWRAVECEADRIISGSLRHV